MKLNSFKTNQIVTPAKVKKVKRLTKIKKVKWIPEDIYTEDEEDDENGYQVTWENEPLGKRVKE